MQVIRANYGLRSLEQAPLLQQRIRSEEARGNFAAAWELEQDLITLARRQPNDLGAAPILHEIGDKRMDLLRDYLDGGIPPQIILGCYYQGPQKLPSPVAEERFQQLHLGAKGHRSGNDPHGGANALLAGDWSIFAAEGLFQQRASRARNQVAPHQLLLWGLLPGRSAKPVAARFVWGRQRGAAVAANRFAHAARRLGPVVRPAATSD